MKVDYSIPAFKFVTVIFRDPAGQTLIVTNANPAFADTQISSVLEAKLQGFLRNRNIPWHLSNRPWGHDL